MNDIWDAIIGSSFDYTIPPDLLEGLEQGIDDDEHIAGYLRSVVENDKTSAKDLVWAMCTVLLHYPQFCRGDASLLSMGMLVEQECLQSEESSAECLTSRDALDVLMDILLPNLYCVLLLETDTQPENVISPLTLAEFWKMKNTDCMDYSQVSRVLTSPIFPTQLKDLLGIQPKKGSEKYQICTNFPNLLLAMIKHLNSSPLSHNEQTANSYVKNISFYEKCYSHIAPGGKWTVKSFEEFYILERIFRIETKLKLFDLVIKEMSRKDRASLFPLSLLADFFFSSPLVLFPANILSTLFCKGFIKYEYGQISVTQSLHFLIQLSSYWFPQILNVMRCYMKGEGIKTYDDVNRFLFPEQTRFDQFVEKNKPTFPSHYLDIPITRAEKEEYQADWSVFTPNGGYCSLSMKWNSLRDWYEKSMLDRYSIPEQHALRLIQDALDDPSIVNL